MKGEIVTYDMNETAVLVILECLEENLFEPTKRWPNDVFEERSYSRWAAYEIWQRLLDNPFKTTDEVIEEFILDMQICHMTTEDPKKERMFKIAIETADDILSLF